MAKWLLIPMFMLILTAAVYFQNALDATTSVERCMQVVGGSLAAVITLIAFEAYLHRKASLHLLASLRISAHCLLGVLIFIHYINCNYPGNNLLIAIPGVIVLVGTFMAIVTPSYPD